MRYLVTGGGKPRFADGKHCWSALVVAQDLRIVVRLRDALPRAVGTIRAIVRWALGAFVRGRGRVESLQDAAGDAAVCGAGPERARPESAGGRVRLRIGICP